MKSFNTILTSIWPELVDEVVTHNYKSISPNFIPYSLINNLWPQFDKSWRVRLTRIHPSYHHIVFKSWYNSWPLIVCVNCLRVLRMASCPISRLVCSWPLLYVLVASTYDILHVHHRCSYVQRLCMKVKKIHSVVRQDALYSEWHWISSSPAY